MNSMFGPNGERVLTLITRISDLSADQVEQVSSAWKRGNSRERARAWTQLNRAMTEQERYRILVAASLARREALCTARRLHRVDWAFWAAAYDAGAAVVAGARIGRHYDTLVAPLAAIMPALASGSTAAPAAGQPPQSAVPRKSA